MVRALLDLVNSLRPDVAVLSGDITQRARNRQFARALHFLKHLNSTRQIVIPGNHDVPLFNLPMRLINPYANHIAAFGEDLEPVCHFADALIIGVKTTRRYRHKRGEISNKQIERIGDLLVNADPGHLRLVVAHHPFYVERIQDRKDLLVGSLKALREWSRAGADLILGGHIHFPYISPLHQRIDEISRPTWVVQAGTAVSKRIRWNAGNSVNMIHYQNTSGERSCTVERWDFDGCGNRFSCAEVQRLELSPCHNRESKG